jgi:hypothetical protein
METCAPGPVVESTCTDPEVVTELKLRLTAGVGVAATLVPVTTVVDVFNSARQEALVPRPVVPTQSQVQGPVPDGTGTVVPEVHRFTVGAKENLPPFALPQAPLAKGVALFEGIDDGPLPTEFVAKTVNV